MINLVREVDLPYILDKFKKIEPVQTVDYTDIPADMDGKSRAIYSLVVDAISNAKKYAGYEIENISDILNNFITETYTKFADINSTLDSDTKSDFTESLDKSIDKLNENLIISNEVEKTQIERIQALRESVESIKELILSLKASYEKYISSIIDGFKDEFDDIEKRFETLIDSKLSKEFQNNTEFNRKVDSTFKSNLYIKKILEKFNVQYAASLKGIIPAQITIISDKMKRKIDAEKERIAKEKSQVPSIAKLFKKYGLLGGMIALGFNAKSTFKSLKQISFSGIVKGTTTKLKKAAYYLVDTDLKNVNRSFGLVGVAASLTAKGLYGLFGNRSAYLSVKNQPKKQKISKPDFSKFEIDKKLPVQNIIFKIYDFAEIIRLNLLSFDQDITESYNARKKLEKEREKELKKKEFSNITNKFGLSGALFWLLRPMVSFLGRKIGGFLSKVKNAIGRKISKFWRTTLLGKRIEAFRVSRLAKKLMRRYPGLSKTRAFNLARSARVGQRAAARATAKVASKGLFSSTARALGKIGGPLALGINLIVGIMDSNNKMYMSSIYGVAEDQIDAKHQVAFSLAAMVAGGGSIIDNPSAMNWLNLGLNMVMWKMLLGPIGIGVGLIFNLIGQERLARFIHANPYASLGIAVGLVGLNPAVVAATGGWSIAIGLGAVGIGALVDRISRKESWHGATEIGKSVGMITGALAGIGVGIALGMKAGALIGTLIVPGLGTIVGGAVGAIVGVVSAVAVMFAGKWVGGLIGSLFESDKSEINETQIKIELKDNIKDIMRLNAKRFHSDLVLENAHRNGRKDSYSFDSMWLGIQSLDKLNEYLRSDVETLLNKKQQIIDGKPIEIFIESGEPTSIVNNPAKEAAEREERRKEEKNKNDELIRRLSNIHL